MCEDSTNYSEHNMVTVFKYQQRPDHTHTTIVIALLCTLLYIGCQVNCIFARH